MKKQMQILQKGFTLVELLIYMGIFSILLFVLLQLFSAILSTHAESQATSGLSQDSNYIFSRLSYDVRRADSSSISVPSASQVQMTISGSTYLYQYDSTKHNLTLSVAGGTPDQINSINTTINQVGDIAFTLLGNSGAENKPTVQVVLKLTSTSVRPGNTTQSKTYQTTIGSR